MLQVGGLSLTRLQLLISLVQLSLEVVDVALGSSQLILSMLQLGVGVTEVIGHEVTAVVILINLSFSSLMHVSKRAFF
jgi:hypothetical protein